MTEQEMKRAIEIRQLDRPEISNKALSHAVQFSKKVQKRRKAKEIANQSKKVNRKKGK